MLTPTVTANVWMRCQNNCSYCVAHIDDRTKERLDDGRDWGQILDVHALIRWVDRFRPDARFHISGGGEAILYDGIEDWIETLLKTGRKVTILTNGQAVYKRTRLHNKPINWIVTYHRECGIDPKEYIQNLECIKKQNVEIRTIIERAHYDTEAEDMDRLKTAFKGFRFIPRYANFENKTARIWGIPETEGLPCVASNLLTLVENSGDVYPCMGKRLGKIGNIFDMTLDIDRALQADKTAAVCAERHMCGALNTAAWEQHLEETGVWK